MTLIKLIASNQCVGDASVSARHRQVKVCAEARQPESSQMQAISRRAFHLVLMKCTPISAAEQARAAIPESATPRPTDSLVDTRRAHLFVQRFKPRFGHLRVLCRDHATDANRTDHFPANDEGHTALDRRHAGEAQHSHATGGNIVLEFF